MVIAMAASRQRTPRKRDLSFYLSEQEQAQAAEAARLEGIDTEIALLRLLIRKAAREEKDSREVRLRIEALCKALRLQHLLSGRSADTLAEMLGQALDEVGLQMEAEP